MDRRSRWLFLSAVFIPLAASVGAILAFVWILKRFSPIVFAARDASGFELLMGMAILLTVLLVGFLFGTLVLVIVWRPHVSRSTLEDIVTKPPVPVISPFLDWFFNWIYPGDK